MLTTIERIFLLQDVEVFSQASTDHLAALAAICEERSARPGERLFDEGEPARSLYILTDGLARLENRQSTSQVEKCPIDIWPCLARMNYTVTATAVGPCNFLVVNVEELLDLLGTEPELALALLQQLAAKQAEKAV